MLPVPFVMADRPRDQVGGRPDREAQRGQIPAHQRKAEPLDDFSQVIGTRDNFEKPAARNGIVGCAAAGS